MRDHGSILAGAAAVLRCARPRVLIGAEVAPEVDVLLAALGLEPVRGAGAGASAQVVISNDPDLVAAAPDAIWVHAPTAGVDRLLAGRGLDGVLLTRTVGEMPRRMAEYVVAVALSRQWDLPGYRKQQERRRWAPRTTGFLYEQEVWVVGTGEIGERISASLVAHGCEVVGVSASGRSRPGRARTVRWDDLPAVIPAGLVVAALPLTAATRGLLDAAFFARLRGAHLVNVGRGATVDQPSLLTALHDGSLGHASLDVTDPEPPGDDSPLWDHPGVTLTPHVSGPTHAADVVGAFTDTRDALLDGRLPSGAVDLPRGY